MTYEQHGFLRCPKSELTKLIKEHGNIGIVGNGFVGNAVHEFFKENCNVLVYDTKGSSHTLKQVVDNSEVIFLCLPTPMEENGKCHTGIVESVIEQIKNTALISNRPLDSFVTVVKSTVSPRLHRRNEITTFANENCIFT